VADAAGASVVVLTADTGRHTAEAFIDRVLAPGASAAGNRVVAVMVASVDGQTAIEGRSGALGHPADRAVFRELRGRADAVLVGSATIAAEGYGNLIDAETADRRAARGQAPHPLVSTVSRSLTLPVESDLFRTADVPLLVFTTDAATHEVPEVGAALEIERVVHERLTPRLIVDTLHGAAGELVVCEGGSTLLDLLLAAGVVDDLILTVAPVWAGGDGQTPLSGPSRSGARSLRLEHVARADDHLFLHYRLTEATR